jgi:hypothetical protein
MTVFTDTYCWGSSTFGQLGFENGEGNFSYSDALELWTGHSGDNAYYDRQTRMEATPRKVEFK